MNTRRFISKLTAWSLTFALILALAPMFTPAANANDMLDSSVVTAAVTSPGSAVENPDTYAVIPFADVSADDWFASSVMFVFENGFMTGTSTVPLMFSPNAPLTQGMVVRVLYSAAGSPPVGDGVLDVPFNDIPADTWYTDAVVWAAENGIIRDYGDGLFGPDDNTTRQDLAVIISNFARFAGLDLPVIRSYTAFSDETYMDGYAIDHIVHLYQAGVISGRPGNVFDPRGNATRAEFAAMLTNFMPAPGQGSQQEEVYPDEVYVEMMEEFEDSFSQLLRVLIDIAIEVDFVDSEDDLANWRESNPELRDAVENAAAHLTDMASYTPEKYAEAHQGYAMVAEYVLNALTAFIDAVEAAFDEGDEDAAIIAMNEFLNDMLTANELWLIARTGLASILYRESLS